MGLQRVRHDLTTRLCQFKSKYREHFIATSTPQWLDLWFMMKYFLDYMKYFWTIFFQLLSSNLTNVSCLGDYAVLVTQLWDHTAFLFNLIISSFSIGFRQWVLINLSTSTYYLRKKFLIDFYICFLCFPLVKFLWTHCYLQKSASGDRKMRYPHGGELVHLAPWEVPASLPYLCFISLTIMQNTDILSKSRSQKAQRETE